MRKAIGWTMALLLGLAAGASATVIIDGTAPGYTLDGSFESGGVWQGPGTALAANLGITSAILYRSNAQAISDGARYVVVDQSGRGAYVNTGYVIKSGDIFDASFTVGIHAGTATGESVNLKLFTTTTDTAAGVVDDLLATVNHVTAFNWSTGSQSGITAPASAVGETLFVSATTGPGGATALMGVDQVNVNVIPEPATFGLLGVGAVAFFLRRRRG